MVCMLWRLRSSVGPVDSSNISACWKLDTIGLATSGFSSLWLLELLNSTDEWCWMRCFALTVLSEKLCWPSVC